MTRRLLRRSRRWSVPRLPARDPSQRRRKPESLMLSPIPIYCWRGRLLCEQSEVFVRANAHHFRLVCNRRGHLERAYVKPPASFDCRPNSTVGLHFEQTLSSGRVWALRGARGSGGAGV